MWSLGAPDGRLPGGRQVGLGLGQSFAQLTSLVQNLLRGAGKGWWQGGVGAQGLGPFPGQNWHHSLAARPQRWVVCRGGGAADGGPIPSHQQNLGRNGAGEAGLAGWPGAQWPAAHGWARLALARRLAHSKVSHCFLSCSTEPGAGAGLTSCLVFRNKSSKGSLVSPGAEGCSAGSRPCGGLGGRRGGSPGLRASPCLASAALALERARGNVRILEGATTGGPRGCKGLVWAPMGIWPKRLGMERADRLG